MEIDEARAHTNEPAMLLRPYARNAPKNAPHHQEHWPVRSDANRAPKPLAEARHQSSMKALENLLREAWEMGWTIIVEGERVRVVPDCPGAKMPPEMRAELRERKAEIIERHRQDRERNNLDWLNDPEELRKYFKDIEPPREGDG